MTGFKRRLLAADNFPELPLPQESRAVRIIFRRLRLHALPFPVGRRKLGNDETSGYRKAGHPPEPEDWRWSSSRFYLLDEAGRVGVEQGWEKISFQPRVA